MQKLGHSLLGLQVTQRQAASLAHQAVLVVEGLAEELERHGIVGLRASQGHRGHSPDVGVRVRQQVPQGVDHSGAAELACGGRRTGHS